MSSILLIDPEPYLLKALETSPVMAGHELVAAAGNVDALRRLRFTSFDVVITSPETTVDEDLVLLEEVRRMRPGARSIVLTGRASRKDVLAALAARVFAVFARPFDFGEITAMVSAAAASAPGHDGITVKSAVPDWLAVRLDCSLLTAERILRFISELRAEVPLADREGLLVAYREVLLAAIEHGAARAIGKLVDVVAVRTERAIVFYVRDPSEKFSRLRLPADFDVRTEEEPGFTPGKGGDPGYAEAYRLLVARTIVDEMLYNEHGNEVILIKHTQ